MVAAGRNTANLAVAGFSPGLIDVAGAMRRCWERRLNPGGTLTIDKAAGQKFLMVLPPSSAAGQPADDLPPMPPWP